MPYSSSESSYLSPFYDLVSTAYWPALGTRLSMRFGSTYKLEDIRKKDLAGFASDLGVKSKIVEERAERMIEESSAAWEHVSALPELKTLDSIALALRDGWEKRSGLALGMRTLLDEHFRIYGRMKCNSSRALKACRRISMHFWKYIIQSGPVKAET